MQPKEAVMDIAEIPQFILPAWELAFLDEDDNEIERLSTDGGEWLMDPDGTLHSGRNLVCVSGASKVMLHGHDGLTWVGSCSQPITLRVG